MKNETKNQAKLKAIHCAAPTTQSNLAMPTLHNISI